MGKTIKLGIGKRSRDLYAWLPSGTMVYFYSRGIRHYMSHISKVKIEFKNLPLELEPLESGKYSIILDKSIYGKQI